MELGIPVDIRDAEDQTALALDLRDEGLVSWVELQLPRSPAGAGPEVRQAAAAAAEELGVGLSLHSEATTFAAARDGAIRERTAEALVETVGLARELGARIITLHPPLAAPDAVDGMAGGHWTDAERAILREATADQDQAEAWFREVLLEAAEEAGAAGVALALENMRVSRGRTRLNSAGELARFVGDLGHSAVGLCLDVRKATRESADVARLIGDAGDMLRNVHASGSGPRGNPAPVTGTDGLWLAAASALREARYHGPVIYEGPAEAARESLKALREVFVGVTNAGVGGAQ